MKYVKTMNGNLLRWESIYRIGFEYDERLDMCFPYFYVSQEEKYDAIEVTDWFGLFEGENYLGRYRFDGYCCGVILVILCRRIVEYFSDSGFSVFDVDIQLDKVWEEFICWAKDNISRMKRIE